MRRLLPTRAPSAAASAEIAERAEEPADVETASAERAVVVSGRDEREADADASPETSGAAPAPGAAPAAAPGRVASQLAPRPAPAAAPAAAAANGYADDPEFLAEQRRALLAERVTYLEQASSLRAEAELLVAEMEPGDVQFDEESGEGGTVTVDRERDLALSAQALAAVQEIDAALAKMEQGRYGVCEGCGQLIVKPRLEALPYARLCIACKSGGLSRR